MEAVESYKCTKCGELFDAPVRALRCEYEHIQKEYANQLWQDGQTLATIEYLCGFYWGLRNEELGNATKDSCFVISHWQCCEKPAYRITVIEGGNYIYMCGKGNWSGYYGNSVRIDNLKKYKVHDANELYIHKTLE